MSVKNHCQNCNERKVGCHCECQKYAEYKKAMDETQKKKEADRIYNLGFKPIYRGLHSKLMPTTGGWQ